VVRSDLKNTAAAKPDNPHSEPDEKLIVGHGPLAEFLTERGFPTAKSTISKACSPAIGTGPPIHAYWGRLPAFIPSVALAWARARLRPPDEVWGGAKGAEASRPIASPAPVRPAPKATAVPPRGRGRPRSDRGVTSKAAAEAR
jgi:hypothetical protein